MTSHTKNIAQAKSSTPWSDRGLQSVFIFSVMVTVAIIMLSWPDRMLYKFVLNGEIPKTFTIVTISIVLLISIVSVVFGRAEAKKALKGLSPLPEKDGTPGKRESWFFIIIFFQSVLHTFLLLILFIPLVLPGVAISRLSWLDLASTMAIIYSTALTFRMFGFSVYLFLSKRDVLDTFVTALFFLSFFLFTAIWLDFINPLVLIYYLNLGQEMIAPVPVSAFSLYQLALLSLVLFLALVCYLKIHVTFR